MVIMTALFALGAGQPVFTQNPPATLGITVLAMAAVYGVVCGAMMLAGEKEGGTLVFLDVFLGRRGLLWCGKFLVGVVLVITEALAVATALTLLQLEPPGWMATIAGQGSWNLVEARPVSPSAVLWFFAVPMVTLEALAWGLLGSALTKRVLAGAGLGILMGFFAWMLTIAFPPPASIAMRGIVFGCVLLGSYAIFLNQVRDTFLAEPIAPIDSPKLAALRELERERHIDYRTAELAREKLTEPEAVVVPAILAEPRSKARPQDHRRRRFREAESPGEVLLWLIFRQGQVVLPCLAAATFLMGFF